MEMFGRWRKKGRGKGREKTHLCRKRGKEGERIGNGKR